MLSVIIPVFNEKNTIEEIIKRVEKVFLSIKKEIIVVDDGSFDETKDILKRLKKEIDFKLIVHKKNRGKGAAVRTGIENSGGEIILIQDADLEYSPEEYQNLIEPILKNETDVVYGSRDFLNNPHSSQKYYLGGKFLTFVFNLLFGTNLTDINTGYKVFKKEVLKNIELLENDFSFCEEVTAKVVKLGYKIKEMPIQYLPRSFKQGKKIRWYKDGLKALYVIMKYRIKS